jgi:glycosyltransferase involved in cell wall biosynthesis
MTQPHKILYVIPELKQGGAERQLLELMHRLPPRFAPTLLVYDGEQIHYARELPPGEPRHVLGIRRMSWGGLKRLAQVIADEQPAIVHSYRDRANLWTRVALLLGRVRVPIVITSVRNRNIDPLNLLAEVPLAGGTDRILANSEGVRRELVDRARLSPDRIDTVYNFLDVQKFHAASPAERAAARARWGLSEGEVALLLPGRLSFQKHQLGLLFALWRLRRQARLPATLRVLLAGRASDRLGRVVRWLAPKLGATVRLLGPVTEMVSLYHASDAVLLASLYEGMPNAVAEAHACGLPVVVSRAANADGLVLDGESGFVVPTADSEALGDAIVRLCALDAAERAAMGTLGRAHVTAKLEPAAILRSIVDLYDGLLATKGLSPVLAQPELQHQ